MVNGSGRARVAARCVMLLVLALPLASCSRPAARAAETCQAVTPGQLADRTLTAFIDRDGPRLAGLVDPGSGVRFSPSAFVDKGADVVLTRDQVRDVWRNPKTLVWGRDEGSGDPIRLTAAAFAGEVVAARAFRDAARVRLGSSGPLGTTRDNIAAAYPGSTVVEYLITPAAEADFADRAALRLVFGKRNGCLFLIGVVRDGWSS